jgi:hypothetical protein
MYPIRIYKITYIYGIMAVSCQNKAIITLQITRATTHIVALVICNVKATE